MRIAIVGLGSIAQRAYLPTIVGLSDVDLILCSRDRARLERVAAQYRISEYTTNVAELASMRIDAAFVHVATEAHSTIVSSLLGQGIHVYVDKPLAYTLDAASRLAASAKSTGRLLMVGFNRRHAPMYRALASQPDRRLVIMQKNRNAQPDVARRFIFDDFIHVVDTLRWLAPGPIEAMNVSGGIHAGQLHHVLLQLSGYGFGLVGIMNRDSGANEEALEVMSAGHKWRVQGLDTTTHLYGGVEQVSHFNDWDSVLWRRGFPQLIQHFLDCIRSQSKAVAVLDDALATHAMCEQIVMTLEAQGAMPMLPGEIGV
jgi:virulence factor